MIIGHYIYLSGIVFVIIIGAIFGFHFAKQEQLSRINKDQK